MKRAYSTKPGSRGCRPSPQSKSLPCERRAPFRRRGIRRAPCRRQTLFPAMLPMTGNICAPAHALANLLIFDTRPLHALSDAQKGPCCPSPRALGRSRQTASSFPRSRRTPSVSEKVSVKNCSRTPADVAVISPAARHPGLRSRRAFGTATRRTKSDAGFRALGAPTHVQTRQTPRPSFPKSPGKSPRRLTAGPLPRAACSLFQTIKIRAIAS